PRSWSRGRSGRAPRHPSRQRPARLWAPIPLPHPLGPREWRGWYLRPLPASAGSLSLRAIVPVCAYESPASPGVCVKTEQLTIQIRQIADEPAQRRGQHPHQGWRRDDVLSLGQRVHLENIDDLQLEPAFQAPLAKRLQIGNGAGGDRRGARHIEPQNVYLALGFRSLPTRHYGFLGRMSRPTKARSVLERSPMIFLTGSGRRRTRVGIARIWSPRASLGFSSRSIASMLYFPARCVSQIFLRLANASVLCGVWPATYRRISQTSCFLFFAACLAGSSTGSRFISAFAHGRRRPCGFVPFPPGVWTLPAGV